MTTPFDANAFARDFATAINKKDPEALLRHYSENVELRDPTTPTPLRGKAGVRQNAEQWGSSISELEIVVKEAIVSGSKVALVLDAKGRHTGELVLGPTETVPATNKVIRLEVANFLTLDNDGKIIKDVSIFDQVSMMTQLGLMPDPQASSASQTERGRMTGTGARGR